MPISSFAITLITIGLLFVLMLFSLSAQTMAGFGILLILPVTALFINRPRMWLGIIFFLFASNLFLPFISQSILVFDLMAIPFSLFILLDHVMGSRSSTPQHSPMRTGVILFAVLLIVTMSVRGIGVSLLGSDLWGGSIYVAVLSRIGLLLTASVMELPAGVWKRYVILMAIGSFVPFFAQLLFTLSGGTIYQQYNFIKFSHLDMGTLNALELGQGMARFQTGSSGTILGFLPFLLFRNPLRGGSLVVSLLLWLLSIMMIGLSGYRIEMVSLVVVWGFIVWLGEKRFRIGRPLVLAVVAVALICAASLGARHYPLSVQRLLTIVPFADVSSEARYDADLSLTWRLNIWKEAAKDIPDYLWIGKGLAFDGREYMASMKRADFNDVWPLITRTYHNGPLGLLLIFGLPGLLLGILILLGSAIRYLKAYRQPWPDAELQNAYRIVLAWFLTQVVVFLFVYGDFQISFTTLFFQMMILEGMLRSRWRLQQVPADNAATAERNHELQPHGGDLST